MELELQTDGAGRWEPPGGSRTRVAAPATGGRVLAVTEEGPHSYDPDYLLVHHLAYRLQGDHLWLLLERVNEEQQFLQGKRRLDGRYYLEYRAGGPARHFAAYVEEWHLFARSFSLYAQGATGWRQEIDWRLLRFAD